MLCLAFIVCNGELSAQNGSYVGAETCGKCHSARLAGQSASAHAHALSLPALQPLAAVESEYSGCLKAAGGLLPLNRRIRLLFLLVQAFFAELRPFRRT